MLFTDPVEIPHELTNLERTPEDVSILIGANGSGKSTLLNNLSQHFLTRGQDVIAIANSIHDKFETGHRNFRTLRGRAGRRQTRLIMKKALERIAQTDIQKLKNASRALTYVQFDPVIGFKIENLDSRYEELIQFTSLSIVDQERIIYLLDITTKQSYLEIIWLEIEGYDFEEVQKSALTELFLWESVLRKAKILNRIEVFLRKQGKVISMLDASSGELVLITSIVYLSTVITENTVILIDEPENSLHPIWQKEYVKTILDIFYLYQPKIIIATHSPLIVNGAELFTEQPKIFKSHNFSFELQQKDPVNVEEIYSRFFDLNTPQSMFLTHQIIRLLNLLAAEKITLENFNIVLSQMERKSYDPRQIEALEAVKRLAIEI